MMSAVQSSSSNSGLDASVPVGDLAEDIPLRDRRLAKFLYSFREYNSHNVQLFSEEVFKDHLRAADLFSFDHLKMVLTDLSTTNNFKELFVNGDEASRYNFGTRMFRCIMMSWVQNIADAESGAALAASASAASSSSSSSSALAAGSSSGSQDVAAAAGGSGGKGSLTQTLDLDSIPRLSSEKNGMNGRVRQLQPGLRMMEHGRITFLSNFYRLELDLDRYRSIWNQNYFLTVGNSSDEILKTFPEAGLFAKVRGLPVFMDNDKLLRFLTFSFDNTRTGCLSLRDFCMDEPWVFDFGTDNRLVRTVSNSFKVYLGRCVVGLVDSLVFVNGTEYEPLRAVCSEPYNGYGVVANYPDVYLFILYHQLLVSVGRLLNDSPGSVEMPLHGPEYIVPILVQRFKDLNKFVDVDKLPLAVFESSVLPCYSFGADPVLKRGRTQDVEPLLGSAVGVGLGKPSKKAAKKQKAAAQAAAQAAASAATVAGHTSASSSQRLTPVPDKGVAKTSESGYCVFNLASLTDVLNGGQKPYCSKEREGKTCSRTHALTHESVTTSDAVAAFDAMLARAPNMTFLSAAKKWYEGRK